MIREYCRQLSDIQTQKAAYKHARRKNRAACQQEDRYQAYILDQMGQQALLIAASQISHSLSRMARATQRLAFNSLRQAEPLRVEKQAPGEEQSMTVDCILLKLCCETVARSCQRANHLAQKEALNQLRTHTLRAKTLTTAALIVNRQAVRPAFRKIMLHKPPKLQPKHMLEESFSVIGQPQRKTQLEESYLSCFSEKQNHQQLCQGCRQTSDEAATLREELARLRQEQAYLRKLLAEKVLQLKRYEEGGSRKKVGSSASTIRNEESIMEMEQQVMGRRIRNNAALQSQSELSARGEPINQQLLGKYMRESFQLRETMDIVREMCVDLSSKAPLSLKKEISLLVRTLGPAEEVSLVDEY